MYMNDMSFLPSRHKGENQLKKLKISPCKAFCSQQRVKNHQSGALWYQWGWILVVDLLPQAMVQGLGHHWVGAEHHGLQEPPHTYTRAGNWDFNEPTMILVIRLAMHLSRCLSRNS